MDEVRTGGTGDQGAVVQVVSDSVQARMERERAKAIEKYGEIALLPGGHPDYDILDYAINEVVGLHRYGEMLMARADEHREWATSLRNRMLNIGQELQEVSADIGDDLIWVRENLLLDGHNLGKPETR